MYLIGVLDGALSWLFPHRCATCDAVGQSAFCQACRDETSAPTVPQISFQEEPQSLDHRLSLFRYEGRARTAILRFKHDRITSLGDPLADIMLEAYSRHESALCPDLILPVPIHWRRWCLRGFNQAEWLCKKFPRDKVIRHQVRRVRYTRYQFSLSPSERESNLRDAFQVSNMEGKRVLLVDDVYTSGATGRELARTAKAAGAAWVGILTLAVAELDSDKEKGHPLKVPPGL